MIKKNLIKIALKEQKVVLGIFINQIRSPAISLILEECGLNFFIIDMEHGSFSYQTIEDVLIATRGLTITPIVRVPGITKECILKPLDAGALGIIVPMVETKEEAETVVSFAKYEPEGSRSLAKRRPHSGFKEVDPKKYTYLANNNILIMLQIESVKGMINLDKIIKTSGIDLIFIGPSDLSLSIKANNFDISIEEAIINIINICKKNEIPVGIHTNDIKYIKNLVQFGVQLISINTDIGLIMNTLSTHISKLRVTIGEKLI